MTPLNRQSLLTRDAGTGWAWVGQAHLAFSSGWAQGGPRKKEPQKTYYFYFSIKNRVRPQFKFKFLI